MQTLFFKPEAGRLVRDPVTGATVPPEGRKVPRNDYWLRRIADGDGHEARPQKPAKPKED